MNEKPASVGGVLGLLEYSAADSSRSLGVKSSMAEMSVETVPPEKPPLILYAVTEVSASKGAPGVSLRVLLEI
jgi:hypothetical protein